MLLWRSDTQGREDSRRTTRSVFTYCCQRKSTNLYTNIYDPKIKIPWLIHAKGALFVLLGILAAVLLFTQVPTIKTAVLICITVWAFCRFYYYLFYVIGRYLGRNKQFSGVLDVVQFLLRGDRDKMP